MEINVILRYIFIDLLNMIRDSYVINFKSNICIVNNNVNKKEFRIFE